MSDAPLLEVVHLATHFMTDDGLVKAVDDVSFTVRSREALAIVGDSGSGKSVCLLCFERDCACCHRSRIAEVVRDRTGIEVENLAPALF